MTEPETPKGLAEEPQKPYSSRIRDELLRKPPKFERLRVGDGGRVVIPAAMREEMGIKPGDDILAHVEDGVLHLVSYQENLRRIQDEVSKYKKPGESVVDEFLAERRAMWGEE